VGRREVLDKTSYKEGGVKNLSTDTGDFKWEQQNETSSGRKVTVSLKGKGKGVKKLTSINSNRKRVEEGW